MGPEQGRRGTVLWRCASIPESYDVQLQLVSVYIHHFVDSCLCPTTSLGLFENIIQVTGKLLYHIKEKKKKKEVYRFF